MNLNLPVVILRSAPGRPSVLLLLAQLWPNLEQVARSLSANASTQKAAALLPEIFERIRDPSRTREGLKDLNQLLMSSPMLDIDSQLRLLSEPVKKYVLRQLTRIGQANDSSENSFSNAILKNPVLFVLVHSLRMHCSSFCCV